MCWGSSDVAQLGTGTNLGSSNCSGWGCSLAPTGVLGLTSGVSAISADGDHVCALTIEKGIVCWGDNYYGQLGVGTNAGPDTCLFGGGDSVPCALSPTEVVGF